MSLSLPSHIQAIVFDAYGTLFNVDAIESGLSRYFGTHASAISEVWRRKQLEYTWLRTLMGTYKPFSEVTAEALEFACEYQRVSFTPAIQEDLMQQYFVLDTFPEVPELLARLSAHTKLAILSNANPEMLSAAADHNQISASLSNIFSANSVAQFKPVRAVYAIASHGLGYSPAEIAFVSSNTWDVTGASAYGFHAIWLNRNQSTMEKLGYPPAQTIKELEELLMGKY